jgi:hypothetical protein
LLANTTMRTCVGEIDRPDRSRCRARARRQAGRRSSSSLTGMAITKPGRAAGTIPESGERKIAVPAPDGSSNIEIPGVAEGGAATNLPETVRFLRAQRNACRCEAATLECVSRNFTPWKMLMSDAVANAAHVRVRRLCLEPPAPATDQLQSSETIMTDLFTPMDLQGLALPNRIWMSAMTRTRA